MRGLCGVIGLLFGGNGHGYDRIACGGLTEALIITSRYEISPALFPRLLANAVNLKVLYLGGNYFTGTLPSSWGLMTAMEDIDLAYNEELSGTLPLEWGAWPTRNSAPTASFSWTTS